MIKKDKLADSLGYINNALDTHDYDTASKYAHLLTTSFCGLKNHTTSQYKKASKIQKGIRSLKHTGHRIDLNVKNTKAIHKLKNLIDSLYPEE